MEVCKKYPQTVTDEAPNTSLEPEDMAASSQLSTVGETFNNDDQESLGHVLNDTLGKYVALLKQLIQESKLTEPGGMKVDLMDEVKWVA